jgi:hypothetical protein
MYREHWVTKELGPIESVNHLKSQKVYMSRRIGINSQFYYVVFVHQCFSENILLSFI